MATNEEMREKFFTKEGVETIDNRIKTLVGLYNKDIFPINEKMWGFSRLEIKTQDECFHRINELCQILGAEFKLETREVDGKETEVLIY